MQLNFAQFTTYQYGKVSIKFKVIIQQNPLKYFHLSFSYKRFCCLVHISKFHWEWKIVFNLICHRDDFNKLPNKKDEKKLYAINYRTNIGIKTGKVFLKLFCIIVTMSNRLKICLLIENLQNYTHFRIAEWMKFDNSTKEIPCAQRPPPPTTTTMKKKLDFISHQYINNVCSINKCNLQNPDAYKPWHSHSSAFRRQHNSKI